MKWCSHCMKSVNTDYVIGTECTFWSCADCGKILGSVYMIGWGQKRRLERARRTPKKVAKETIVSNGRIFFENKTQKDQKNHNEND